MRLIPLFLFTWMTLCQLYGCQEPRERVLLASQVPTQSGTLGFTTETYERRSEGCAEDGPCARLIAVFPKAVSGPRQLVRLVNDSIEQYLRLSMSVFAAGQQQIPPDLDSVARQFILEYERFHQDLDPAAPPWTVESQGKVLYQSPRILSVEIDNFSFTGGAHPNSFMVDLIFDLKTKEMLELEDLVQEKEKFAELVESAFRHYHHIDENLSLNEAGFFWDEPFFLPANAALTEEGLRLVYNPYEVAAYAVGATKLDIPYGKLQGIIREEYLPAD